MPGRTPDPAFFFSMLKDAIDLSAVRRVMPSAAEVAGNPRSRSAVMRVAERTGVAA